MLCNGEGNLSDYRENITLNVGTRSWKRGYLSMISMISMTKEGRKEKKRGEKTPLV